MENTSVVFSTIKKGYDPIEVDQYIALLQNSFDCLEQEYDEILTQKEQLENLNKVNLDKTGLIAKQFEKLSEDYQQLEQEYTKVCDNGSDQANEQFQQVEQQLKQQVRRNQELTKTIVELKQEITAKEIELREAIENQTKINVEQELANQIKVFKDFDTSLNLFNIAQRTCIDYVENIKSAADTIGKQIQDQADDYIARSRVDADKMLIDAKDEANKILAKAKSEAVNLSAKAKSEANEIMDKANAKSDNMESATDERIKKKLDDAQAEYRKIRELIKETTEQYLDICDKITELEDTI